MLPEEALRINGRRGCGSRSGGFEVCVVILNRLVGCNFDAVF